MTLDELTPEDLRIVIKALGVKLAEALVDDCVREIENFDNSSALEEERAENEAILKTLNARTAELRGARERKEHLEERVRDLEAQAKLLVDEVNKARQELISGVDAAANRRVLDERRCCYEIVSDMKTEGLSADAAVCAMLARIRGRGAW